MHAIVAIDHLDDLRGSEPAGVVWLTAGRGIEGRSIEHDRASPIVGRRHIEDARIELGQIGIGVVETLGHESASDGGIGQAGLGKSLRAQAAAVAARRTARRLVAGS